MFSFPLHPLSPPAALFVLLFCMKGIRLFLKKKLAMEFLKAVVLGSGSSSSCPQLGCLLGATPCENCTRAAADPTCKDNRVNPSCLLRLRHPADGSEHSIVIDVGKTFRMAALKSFAAHGVSDLSGVLLTHGHADACLGLDDLREFSRRDAGEYYGTDVFADWKTINELHRQFSYLFPPGTDLTKIDPTSTAPIEGGGSGWNFRARGGGTWTAAVTWHVMQPAQVTTLSIPARTPPHKLADFTFVAVPVLHGPAYLSNAFVVRLDGERVLYYISDVSELTEEAYAQLSAAKVQLGVSAEAEVAVLVLDMLSDVGTYPTHFGLEDSLAATRRIGATKTYFVGMSHFCGHDRLTRLLAEKQLAHHAQLAYDGCVIATRKE